MAWRCTITLVLCACGAMAEPPDASSADAASDATDADVVGCFVCPAALPTAQSVCTSSSDASEGCEYGDFATGDCSSFATCTDAGWNVNVPPTPQCANAAGCPSTYGGSAPSCTAFFSRCDYAMGVCGCVETTDGGLAWTCETTDDPSCPPERPRIGSSCQGSQSCTYGDRNACSPLRGVIVQCDACGTWQLVPILVPPCPH